MLVVVSLRADLKEWYDEYDTLWDGDLEIRAVNTEAEVVKYVADRIFEAAAHPYLNLLLTGWEDMVYYSGGEPYQPEHKDERSLMMVPAQASRYYSDAEYNKEQSRRDEMTARIRGAVKKELSNRRTARRKRQQRLDAKAMVEAQRKKRELDRLDYERLKKVFEPSE
jgi:hypothetical protein